MIQALIPFGLKAIEAPLQAAGNALARYPRDDADPGVVRLSRQAGPACVAHQKLPITVPWVRDRAAGREVSLAT